MAVKIREKKAIEKVWHSFLMTGGFEQERRKRRFFSLFPGYQRCRACYAPFQGTGGTVVRVIYRKRPSNLNPYLCNTCEDFARTNPGGAEIELTLLFADVRGSTSLAESMSPVEFHHLINRFYSTATDVMVHSDALIDKIIGDQVAGMYVPGFAGEDHSLRAIKAAKLILEKTGHHNPEGPWISLGVGVHTGMAFVGSVGSEKGTSDITVLGDVANTAARLSTSAGIGEILISDAAMTHSGLASDTTLERRELNLKGKAEKMGVSILKDSPV